MDSTELLKRRRISSKAESHEKEREEASSEQLETTDSSSELLKAADGLDGAVGGGGTSRRRQRSHEREKRPSRDRRVARCTWLGRHYWPPKRPADSNSKFLAIAIDAAKRAGEIIRKGFCETKHVEHKGQVDLVTETDKACEDLIFNYLKLHCPDHKFIGEETTAANGATELTDDPTWIVDPLDGTTNFVHGFPFVCVSIGLTIGKVPTVGVVYNPIMDELFTGIRGGGAFLNGKPVKVSSQSELVKSLLVTEAGTKRDKLTLDASTNRINSLLYKVRSLRMSGSCALNLCGIACGRLDLFYELGFGGPWDVAGGAVIVQEAGGVLFDPSGGEFDITAQRVAASNALLKDKFVKALKESE